MWSERKLSARSFGFTNTNYKSLHSWAMLMNKLEKKLGNDRKTVKTSLLFKNFTSSFCENCEKSQARRFFGSVLRNFSLLCDANYLTNAHYQLALFCLFVASQSKMCATNGTSVPIKEKRTVNTPSRTRNSTHDNKTRTRMYTSFLKRVPIKERKKKHQQGLVHACILRS